MVVTGEPPAVGEVEVAVSFSIVVGIGGFGELGHLGDEDFSWLGGDHAAAVVKAGGKVLPFEFCGVSGGFGSEDIGAAEADVEGAF